MTPFSTSGQLSIQPSSPISPPPPPASTTSSSTPLSPPPPRVLYLLSAIVCHYGGHGFGHYIAFRRRPKPSKGNSPALADITPSGTGRGWLRVSDENVQEVGIEAVLAETSGAFMLFYEKMTHEGSTLAVTPAPLDHTTTDSEIERRITAKLSERRNAPRIVRSVSSGIVTRAPSVAPAANDPSPLSQPPDPIPSSPRPPLDDRPEGESDVIKVLEISLDE